MTSAQRAAFSAWHANIGNPNLISLDEFISRHGIKVPKPGYGKDQMPAGIMAWSLQRLLVDTQSEYQTYLAISSGRRCRPSSPGSAQQ